MQSTGSLSISLLSCESTVSATNTVLSAKRRQNPGTELNTSATSDDSIATLTTSDSQDKTMTSMSTNAADALSQSKSQTLNSRVSLTSQTSTLSKHRVPSRPAPRPPSVSSNISTQVKSDVARMESEQEERVIFEAV
jgi:hypothetical protein